MKKAQDKTCAFSHCKSIEMELLLESVLQNLGKIDVFFQGGGIQPGRKGNRTVYRTIYLRLPDGRHIHIDQNSTFIFLQIDFG
mgnify:CR=1 FL=1|nr:MAG TPA: hypothetical protein [Caudoviricetes sp.]